MEAGKIIQTITGIFNGADERNWEKVQDSFTDNVLLDYSSMNGSPATVISSEKVIEGALWTVWRGAQYRGSWQHQDAWTSVCDF